MVSGVGPAATLNKYNISIVADRRGVGQNMQVHNPDNHLSSFYTKLTTKQDHLFLSTVYQVSVVTGSRIFDTTFAAEAVNQYNTNATGILTSNRAEYFGFEKLSAAQLSNISATARADLATYPADWPDYEIVIADLGFAPGADYAQAIGMLESQVARGEPILPLVWFLRQ